MSQKQLQELYDSENFKGVSQQTRTDIIGAINLDLEEMDHYFSLEELRQGLRHLLLENDQLRNDYITIYRPPSLRTSMTSFFSSRDRASCRTVNRSHYNPFNISIGEALL